MLNQYTTSMKRTIIYINYDVSVIIMKLGINKRLINIVREMQQTNRELFNNNNSYLENHNSS